MVLLSLLPSAPAAAEVGKEELECILVRAMSAAKNLGAQRDRLVQLRRRLQQRNPGDEDADGIQEEVASGLHKVFSMGLVCAASYLAECLQMALENGDRAPFITPAFAVIPYEQLYGVLREQWQCHSPRPTTQAQAFARIDSAYYAVVLALDHHLPRCIELLVGVRPPSMDHKTVECMIGYSDDPVAAANEHILAIRAVVKRMESGLPEPDPEPAPAAANKHMLAFRAVVKRMEIGFPELDPEPAPAAAAATGMPPQAKSSVDVDHALSYLHRSCSLTSLAVKHLDVVIAFISSFLDPEEVAKISEWTDEHTYYISEEGPYPPDETD